MKYTPEELKSYYADLRATAGECFLWEGCINAEGYGVLWFNGKKWLAHRLAYMFTFGAVVDGLNVAHKCDVKRCVNPYHLELVTNRKNVQDAFDRGLVPTRAGEMNGRSKLTELDVLVIRHRFFHEGVKRSQLARDFGVSWPTVDGIVRGQRWTHV